MNKEILMMIAMTISPLLWMLGGWHWKWLRRFLLPVCLGILLLSVWHWGLVLLWTITQMTTFTLPYGEKTPYWLKTVVGCTYVIPSLLFGFTIWQIVLPVVFIVTFILSNWKPTKRDFAWKICEGTTGFLIGVIVARFIGG